MIPPIRLITTLIIAALLLLSWRSNPPDGRTGAPVDSSCGAPSCHTSGGTDINGNLSIMGLPESLTAGEAYNLTVRLDATAGSPMLGGFQMTALINGNTGVGNFSNPGANVGISNVMSRQYVDHRDAKGFNNDRVEYTVRWTAPSSLPTEDVTFYANSVFANGNGNSSGDRVRMTSETVASSGIVDNDMDGFASDVDCDDNNAAINPNADEIPNNDIDENCDGEAEQIDMDSDGFNSDEDCDDTNGDINPNADEIPNNDVDEDCDGVAFIEDLDNDGFNALEDCDDTDANVNPNMNEVPNNDVDEDCDGEALIIDNDDDGFNSDEDCNDLNPFINPGAMEVSNDSIDNNCNGEVDECICTTDFTPVCGSDGMTYSNACVAMCAGITVFTDGECAVDSDMDGFDADVDCDDGNAAINPEAQEIPGNDVDENCDGVLGMDSTMDISGEIMIGSGTGLANVTVLLSDGTEVITDTDGRFLLENIIPNGNLTLTFSRNDGHSNGVSAIDVVQTANHILGTSTFTEELQLLAADADGSGNVSALDLVHMVNVIIGRWEAFMNRESWGFVPQEISIQDLTSGVSIEVRAYKVGDVNASASPN